MINDINLKIKEILKLGIQNQKEKNFKEAIKNYNNVIKINPDIIKIKLATCPIVKFKNI